MHRLVKVMQNGHIVSLFSSMYYTFEACHDGYEEV